MHHRVALKSLFCVLLALISSAAVGEGRLGAAGARVCFAPEMGGLKCWGEGASTPYTQPGASDRIVELSGGGYVAGFDDHFCYRTQAGNAKCFGDNSSGQIGDGSQTNRPMPTDVIGFGASTTTVSAGPAGSCAVRDGQAWCWGVAGPLVDFAYPNMPALKTGLSASVISIATGGFFACARLSTGDVECWGRNNEGQLGNGSFTSTDAPVRVIGLPAPVVAVAAGPSHVCAITTAGALYCWGANNSGKLGNGSTANASVAQAVVGLTSGVIAVDAGGAHTCAIVTGGAMKCWGDDLFGALGDGPAMGPQQFGSYLPKDVPGISGARTLALDGGPYSFSCASFDNDRVRCWGYNAQGQLGDGTTTERSSPVQVLPLSPLHFRVFASGFDS